MLKSVRDALLGIFVGYAIAFFAANHSMEDDTSSSFIRVLFHQPVEEVATGDDYEFGEHGIVDGEELDEEEISHVATSSSILCVVLLLIVLTIGFEEAKEHIEERSGRTMRPIIESLFGELTVLGFLSVFTFLATKMGVFKAVSIHLFGEDEKDFLVEIFESVHFTLFFIMVFFVLQVLVLVKQGMETEVEWLAMNRKCQDPHYMNTLWKQAAERARGAKQKGLLEWFQRNTSFLSLLSRLWSARDEEFDDQLLFQALRDEFLKERSIEPPFEPLEEKKRSSSDFNFGRYLSICLSQNLAHKVVHVDVRTWIFFAILAIFIYLIGVILNGDHTVLGCIWVAIGWVVVLFNISFERHLLRLRAALCANIGASLPTAHPGEETIVRDLENHSLSGSNTEADYLLPKDDAMLSYLGRAESLPQWCYIDLDAYMSRRPCLSRMLAKGEPNRQLALYFFEREGPKAYLIALQVTLVFTSLYCAVLLGTFIPLVYGKCAMLFFLTYVVFSIIPLLSMLRKKHMIATMTEVGTVGVLRRPQVVADVLREEKTARAVRAFIVLYRIHRGAEMAAKSTKKSSGKPPAKRHYRETFSSIEVAEVSKTFDAFDLRGDGVVSREELKEILENLGGPMDPQQIENMMALLDKSGDDRISRNEFLQWYADSVTQDDFTFKEKAHFFFHLFDHDSSGAITLGEFKAKLDALNLGFTVDEIGDIVKELDEDGSGVIGEEEFEHLLEKYFPRELSKVNGVHERTQD